jgi:type 1 glutamine amidotransferase
MKKITLCFCALIVLTSIFSFHVKKNEKQVLVFSLTKKFRHKSIEKGIEAIRKIGLAQKFSVVATEDPSYFNEEQLKRYKAVIFLSPTGDNLFNDQQKEAFKNYINRGGGFVGIHAATDCNYEWEWYGKLVGAYFLKHPKIQEAKLEILDNKHLSTIGLNNPWIRTDEWYNFKKMNPDVKVLINLDEKSYTGGTMGESHPMAWYHKFDGGKSFYTGLGHTDESYKDTLFLKHLSGGIAYVLK